MNQSKSLYIRRLFAMIVDWYLCSIVASIPIIFFQSIEAGNLLILNRLDELNLFHAYIAGLLGIGIYIVYYCVLPLSLYNINNLGQTFGRKLLKVKLISTDGEPLNFIQLFKRDVIGILLLQGFLTSTNIYILSLVQKTLTIYIVPHVQTFYYITVLFSLLLLIFGKKKQMLHDLISGTSVVYH